MPVSQSGSEVRKRLVRALSMRLVPAVETWGKDAVHLSAFFDIPERKGFRQEQTFALRGRAPADFLARARVRERSSCEKK